MVNQSRLEPELEASFARRKVGFGETSPNGPDDAKRGRCWRNSLQQFRQSHRETPAQARRGPQRSAFRVIRGDFLDIMSV